MEEVILADKYAKGLIAYAQEVNIIDRIDQELASLEKIFTQNTSLREVLLNPAISLQEKKDLLETICKEERISRQAQAFLFVLLKARRINLFFETSKIYRDLVHSLRKRLKVVVEAASSLGPSEKRELKEKLTKIYQRDIELAVHVKSEVIGGMRVCVGHKLYDGTVKTRLNLLRKEIEISDAIA